MTANGADAQMDEWIKAIAGSLVSLPLSMHSKDVSLSPVLFNLLPIGGVTPARKK